MCFDIHGENTGTSLEGPYAVPEPWRNIGSQFDRGRGLGVFLSQLCGRDTTHISDGTYTVRRLQFHGRECSHVSEWDVLDWLTVIVRDRGRVVIQGLT